MPKLPPTDRSKARRSRAYDRERGTAAQRGYGAEWARNRRRYLQQHPLCVECAKREITRAATVVDHIIPAKVRPDLFWNQDNWQPLCASCHGKKTRRENAGKGQGV